MKTIFSIVMLFPLLLMGQINPDRHNTSWTDTWVSCSTSANPNPLRGESHWFMMDLGFEYTLGQTRFWNYNDPENLDRGIQDYFIDYSMNGVTWIELGHFTLNQAVSSSFYQGEIGPDLGQIQAKYVLITPISNYGADCYGLAEIKIAIGNFILPVEIIEFAAECRNGKPHIYWITENEINSDHYDVEISKDGINWDLLKEVKSNNGGNEKQTYFIVNNIYQGGLEYYRLKHYDFNGSVQISDLAKGLCEELTIQYQLAPNPFVNEIMLTTNSEEDHELKYEILNNLGAIIISSKIAINKNKNQYNIDLSSIPAGNYTISLYSKKGISNVNIVKQ